MSSPVDTDPPDEARVVIVEDEQIVAVDIRSHLERFGYTVPAIYASGEAALENISEDAPDLVLFDIRLQGELDGVETAQRVYQEFGLPFIILTAYSDEETLERAKLSRPFAYIIKPFDARELRTSIALSLYRHRMETTLSERQKLLDTTLRSITDGVVVTDPADTIEFVNRVASVLSGVDDEESSGKPFSEVFAFDAGDPDYWPKNTGENACVLRKPDGTGHPVELLQTPLRDSYRVESGTVYVIRDISERVEAERRLQEREEQLRHSQKMEAIGRLSGGVAHDFNNLLTVILGHAKLLVETLDNQDVAISRNEIKADVLGIQKAAFRSVSLTRHLLAFSRHQVLTPRTIRVNTIVSDVEKMLRRLLEDRIVLHIVLDAEDGTVLVDQGQMEQVLMNLVANARDAIEDTISGSVVVRTEDISIHAPLAVRTGEIEPGEWVMLHVQDNGPGISADTMIHLFEPFFTTKEQTRGTGLGLATVYGIVRQLGGHIDVQTKLGSGTRFTVYLPRATMQQNESEQPHTESISVSGDESVLVVEDEEEVRSLLTRVLLQHGYHVMEAQNAGEAFLIAEDERRSIDLVVSDIVMPHVSGVYLADRLRKSREGLRFLFVSGYAEELANLDSSQMPNTAVLQKPFEPITFVEQVRRVLDC